MLFLFHRPHFFLFQFTVEKFIYDFFVMLLKNRVNVDGKSISLGMKKKSGKMRLILLLYRKSQT